MSDEKRSEGELEEKDETAKGAATEGAAPEGDVSVAERNASEDETEEGEDAATPAAIARRVAALGGGDATEE
ncbi:MAG TPA: hypothetical protein VM580_06735, partial [Labilithrix sp.]|nr:hypothetical protein [Labilithrix sp.]